MDPATGGVLAMYGGRDYVTQPYNDATQSAPQAGSTFKPFALAAALEDGIGLSSMWDGHSPQTVQTPDGKPYVVKNDGGESYGKISLLQATEDSVNTVYVPRRCRSAPTRSSTPRGGPAYPSPCTSTAGRRSPWAPRRRARSTWRAPTRRSPPAGSIAHRTRSRSVKGANGGIQYKEKTTGTIAFSPDAIADIDYALQKVVTNGTGFAAQALGRPSAGKTGTTNAGRSAWYTG